MTEHDEDTILTPAQVSEMFNVDRKTVTRWADRNLLPSFRTLGGHRRYYLSEVRAALAATERTTR